MKRTTRNNILRYLISAVFVVAILLIVSLVYIGLNWLTNITGLPISQVVFIATFIYVVWYVGKIITTQEDKEE
jgi:hypothetical protein